MRHTGVSALLLLLTSSLACEPIVAPVVQHRDLASARLELGDPIPELLLTDSGGNRITAATLSGTVATLTFVVPGAAQHGAFLRRIDDVFDRLGEDGTRVRRYLVTLPADPDMDHPPLVEREGWQALRGAPAAVTDLAARFGVVTWRGSDGEPVQTLSVAIIGPGGVVRARLRGLETWVEMDLLVAITNASSPW